MCVCIDRQIDICMYIYVCIYIYKHNLTYIHTHTHAGAGGTAEVSSADFLKALGEVTPVSGRRQSNLLRRFSTHTLIH